eukprot:2813835-Rhodomonas_salina.1
MAMSICPNQSIPDDPPEFRVALVRKELPATLLREIKSQTPRSPYKVHGGWRSWRGVKEEGEEEEREDKDER